MKQSYYILSVCELSKKDNTLRIVTEDGVSKDIPIERVGELYLLNRMTFNTTFFDLLSRHQIPAHFFNYYTHYTGSFYPREVNVSGSLLVQQVRCSGDERCRLVIAKEIIRAAAENKYRNLRYYNARSKDLARPMEQIKALMSLIDRQESVNELMGVEGTIQKKYFEAWNTVVDREIGFDQRVKRPPDNLINTLISFVNTLVYTAALSQIYMTHLDPTVSFLHAVSTRRFSLCLDLAEIFKPLIGDRVIFALLNRNQISDRHFTQGLNYLHLTKEGAQIIVNEFDRALERTVAHPDLGRQVSYRYLIRLECYKLIKHLFGEQSYRGFTIWW